MGTSWREPYRAIGLARNPFEGAAAPDMAGALFVERGLGAAPPAGGRRLVQLLGGAGVGKSAQLAHWRAGVPGPVLAVPPGWGGTGRWLAPPIGAVAYWDDADRLSSPMLALALVEAALAGATIVAATRHDLGALARMAGLSVETHRLASPNPAELMAWAARMVAAVRLPDQPCGMPLLDWEAARGILVRAQGDWHAAGTMLYAWAAEVAHGRARGVA